MEQTPIVLNVADFTQRFTIEPGTLLVVSCPIGVRPQEAESAMREMEQALTMTGASAIFLSNGMTVEQLTEESLSWVAREGLALRGYPVPGCVGETRWKVLHPKLGQLADEPHWLTAIRTAQVAVGPQEPPAPPLQTEPKVSSSGQ
jgi:hypothetical protein